MLLVPRQLQRSGMTGSVPYYGGRFTPAQAYAASHPSSAPAGPPTAVAGGAVARAPLPPPPAKAAVAADPDTQAALRHLRDTGVLTAAEYDDLQARTER